jgi:hypothetical protein
MFDTRKIYPPRWADPPGLLTLRSVAPLTTNVASCSRATSQISVPGGEQARRSLVVDQRHDVGVVGDGRGDVVDRDGLVPLDARTQRRERSAIRAKRRPNFPLTSETASLSSSAGLATVASIPIVAVPSRTSEAPPAPVVGSPGERRVLEDVVESVPGALVHRLELGGAVRHHRICHRRGHLVCHRLGGGVEEHEVLGHGREFGAVATSVAERS